MMTVDYRVRESGIEVPALLDLQIKERIAELEFAAEDAEGWLPLGLTDGAFEFSRGFITTITRLSRLTYVKNPIIQRGVNVKADYIFGRQVTIHAPDEDVNAVIRAFLEDSHNQTVFSSQIARIQKERELQTDGNIFFVLIPHLRTGKIRIRTLDVDEVTDIICDPDDRTAAWYYKREYTEKRFNFASGTYEDAKRIVYYRDWRNKPPIDRSVIGSNPVMGNQYIYHIKVGGFSNWKFGVPETYSAIDWAKAYRMFLENWSSIVAAYASFAFAVTTTGGKPGVTAAAKQLGTSISTSSGERNPKPVAASTFVKQEGTEIEPIRTAGATTSAEDGRRLLLMVCAAFGIPETFLGDVSVGTLATAKSLDRPTELMISNRQVLWADIYNDILQFVLYYAVSAIDGPLRGLGAIEVNEYGENVVTFDDPDIAHIDIDFPSVVESDTLQTIQAIVQGATFDGKTPTILNDARMLARMVLTALGENDIDQLLDAMYNEDGTPKNDLAPKPAQPVPGAPIDPNAPPAGAMPQNAPPAPSGDPLAEAAYQLRTSIDQLREALYPSSAVPLGAVMHRDLNTRESALPLVDVDAFMKP